MGKERKKRAPASAAPEAASAAPEAASAAPEAASAAPEAASAAPKAASETASAAPKAASAAPKAASETASAAPKAALEAASAAENLPEPYEVCPIYQPIRRSFSVRSPNQNIDVAGLLEEIEELRTMVGANRTIGCFGNQNKPTVTFATRSNSWNFHRPPPPPPRPALPSQMTISNERASQPEPVPFRLHDETQTQDRDRRPPWARNPHQTVVLQELPAWARPGPQTWAGGSNLAETQV